MKPKLGQIEHQHGGRPSSRTSERAASAHRRRATGEVEVASDLQVGDGLPSTRTLIAISKKTRADAIAGKS